MTVPDAANTASRPATSPAADERVAPRRTDAVDPFASAICDATVRFHTSS